MICAKCTGTGEVNTVLLSKPAAPCDDCGKSGSVKCTECSGGRVTCRTCEGKGRARRECPICVSTRKAPCGGCMFDSDLSWTTTAECLANAGRGPAALAHLDVAIARLEARNAERLQHYVGSEKERQAFARKLAKEVTTLKTRRSELAKKFGL
ncbi:MAG: hypothetical protein NTV21_13655 [Planctomycetota bacterium]|nr:hypothetical protein [Planctomycetota bacterium]